MPDPSRSKLVENINAKKVVVAQHIENLNLIISGLDELSTHYDGRVRNFLNYYLGTKDHPAPFGGRAADIENLNKWLQDKSAPPYVMMTAPAGRGKSALLAQWVTQLASRRAKKAKKVHIVYFPISIRFNTNLETVVFSSLAARIAHLYGDNVKITPDPQQYRGIFSDYLNRKPPGGGRVLIVIDGLDEAAGWETGADLFPADPPEHLRIVLAARPLAGDADESAWLSRLEWDSPHRAKLLPLERLDRDGVRDVLNQMGNPLDNLATNINIVDRLHDLSEGDPLLVRLYVDSLLANGKQAAIMRPEDLIKLEPGLGAFFKKWFEKQKGNRNEDDPLLYEDVGELLDLCAMALGPLKKDDILILAPEIFKKSRQINKAVKPINRFIIGDGTNVGYVFSHSRMNEYFAGELTEKEQRDIQERFLKYGKDILTELEQKTISPKEASAYIVQHYSAHLIRAKAPAEDFYALMCEGWLRAWEWLEGSPVGFLNDANHAREKAKAAGSDGLGQQIRTALCFSSVVSLSANIPNDLLIACVEAGLISSKVALAYARQKYDLSNRVICLIKLGNLQNDSEATRIYSEALAVAKAISYDYDRAIALGHLALHLPEGKRENILYEAWATVRVIFEENKQADALEYFAPYLPEHLLSEALAVAKTIYNEHFRAEALANLSPYLPKHLLTEVLAAANDISWEWYRVAVLSDLAPHLPKHLLSDALAAAKAINDERCRAKAICHIVPYLSEREREEELPDALAAAKSIADKEIRVATLVDLAPHLPEREQESALSEALAAAKAITDKEIRIETLADLAPHLPVHLLSEALAAAKAVNDGGYRAKAICRIVPYLPDKEREEELPEALAAAKSITYEKIRIETLADLAPHLPERERESALSETLTAARAITDKKIRIEILADLAPHLPERERESALSEGLEAAKSISDEMYRAYTLESLALHLPEGEREKVVSEGLAAAKAITNEWSRASAIGQLALHLSENERAEALSEALVAAKNISIEDYRARALGELVPHLPEYLLSEALAAAKAINDEKYRAEALLPIIPLLPDNERKEELPQYLAATKVISDEEYRAYALGELVPHLPEYLLSEALAAAKAINDERYRAKALLPIIPLLPDNERKEELPKYLAAAKVISDEEYRAYALGCFAPHLPESEREKVFSQGLAAAKAITDEWSRAVALCHLASHLPKHEQEEVFSDALTAAKAINDEISRAKVLLNLAPHLPEKERDEVISNALTAVKANSYVADRFEVMAKLISYLPKKEREKVLSEELAIIEEIAPHKSIFSDWQCAEALGRLTPHLPESKLGQILERVKSLYQQENIDTILAHLVGYWPAVCRATQKSEFEELSETLKVFGTARRPLLLNAITTLLPIIAEQGGEKALQETARAIIDTAKWWP